MPTKIAKKTTKTVKAKSPRKSSSTSKPKVTTKVRKPSTTSKPSKAEQKFAEIWEALYPSIDLYSEYRFCPPRRFRFDFAHLSAKIAIEINGGNWRGGRHTNALALNSEYEKLNLAILNGWKVFVLSPEMITEEWLDAIANAIQS